MISILTTLDSCLQFSSKTIETNIGETNRFLVTIVFTSRFNSKREKWGNKREKWGKETRGSGETEETNKRNGRNKRKKQIGEK